LLRSSSPLSASAQDEPSLGDAARQARLQKQQKEAQAKDAPNPDASKDASAHSSANDPTKKDPFTQTAQPASTAKKTPKVTKVITNEEIPEHVGPVTRPAAPMSHTASDDQPTALGSDAQAEVLRSQITSMKENITSLQSQIDSVNDSIHFAPANCVSNCVQWNERQLQKQQQVEQMKAQLEEQKKQLEDLQESARKQGFGSSIYDP